MKSHEFYRKFANLPLDKRFVVLDRIKHGGLTMNGVYFQMHQLDEKLRPLLIEQQELLEIAEEFLPKIDFLSSTEGLVNN